MKVGQAIHAKGTIVAKKGELEKIFGRNWKIAIVKGKLLGLGKKRKNRVEWPSFQPPFVEEYGAQHRIFRRETGCVPSKRPPSAGEESDDSNGVSSLEEVFTDDQEPPGARQEDREGNFYNGRRSQVEIGSLAKLCRSKKHRGYCDC